MLFKSDLTKQSFEDILYLYKDESIVAKNSSGWDLYFGDFKFGLSICKETNRVLNFIGYSSNFCPVSNIKIPIAKKGAIYCDKTLKFDGQYYPDEYDFQSNGFFDINTGWYRVGIDYVSGEVIEISTNTLINLENGIIKAIYFKPQIANE